MKIYDFLVFALLLVMGASAALHLNDVSLQDFWGDLGDGSEVTGSEPRAGKGYPPIGALGEASMIGSEREVRNREYPPRYVCRRTQKKAIEEVAGPQVYKWVDEHGKTHFGDRPPTQKLVETIDVASRKHYFNLNLNTDAKYFPPYFRDRLTARVNRAYDVLAKLIPEKQLNQVDVNLWVFNTRAGYDDFYSRYASGVASNSQGFHSSSNNIAAALRKTDKQVLATSVHEAVHVMNAGMFGVLPRWLNEGMAEYLENISVYGQSADILVRDDWMDRIRHSRLNLSYLLSADREQWQGPYRSDLYAHSWALVFFLMSHQDGRDFLGRYLSLSANNPCRLLSVKDFIQRHYGGGVSGLDRRFSVWLTSDKLPHHI